MRRRPTLALTFAVLLAGCTRPYERDGGGADPLDSSYDPVTGNRFEGPLVLDDERVRSLDPSRLPAGDHPCREPVLARVYEVNDGDTFEALGEGVVLDARVRIIGVDTPEVAHPGEPGDCYGNEARAFTSQLTGHLVWLSFDNTCLDPYDRLLAYVHVGSGDGDFWQRQLLRRGYATVLTVGDNRTFAPTFEADEAAAESAGAGLWSACF
ncbi:MAG TPA: thermonuclease family protein [Sandaracinaceae bacterium]